MIFHSFSKKLPPIRHDIDLIPIQHEGNELIYFHDPMGYIPENFAMSHEIAPFLEVFSHYLSIDELSQKDYFNTDKAEFLSLVQFLDENNVLHSNRFKLFREKTESNFEEGALRNPWLADKSYPENASELVDFLNTLFEKPSAPAFTYETPKALYAPHIDINVAGDLCAETFSLLKKVRPKRVVILGTSHYAGAYHPVYEQTPFIGSLKDYQLPGAMLKTDKEFMKSLTLESPNNGFTLQDRAHRIEHSIETHLLFLSHIWQHDYAIAPILVSGLEDILYHQKGDLMKKIELFASQLKQADHEDTFYLISGDLSHVGKRFGDSLSASHLKRSVEDIDRKFLEETEKSEAAGLLALLTNNLDNTRICGFPPLYTFLKTFGSHQAKGINYQWWDDAEHESAVSFGSVLFY